MLVASDSTRRFVDLDVSSGAWIAALSIIAALLLVDMQRRVRFAALPKDPLVVRFEIRGHLPRFMLLKKITCA